MLPGKSYTPHDVLRLLHRRRWLVVLPLLACSCAAAIVARALPSVWQSTAVISIVPQRIPESYVRTTVTIGPQDRLEAIRRDILSRERLERIIADFDLYPEMRSRGALPEDVVERMRSNVKMAPAKGDAFEVSFSAGDPVLAQRVAERLANLFIDENIRQRTQLAEGSSEFLKSQLRQVQQQLETTERRLEAYRLAHAGELPDQVQSNLQAITNAQMQLQQLRESLNRDRDRRLILERQVADYRQPVPELVVGPAGAPVAEVASAATQLAQAKVRLADLERRLTPEHPDVVRAKNLVAELTVKAQEEAARAAAGTAATPVTVNPAEFQRQRRLRELETELEMLERNINAKQDEENRLLAVVAEYQARVNAAPAREAELTALLRDYDTVSEQYKTLLANSKAAEMAQELERRQGGEQFRLVEPARIPARPASPRRPLILAGGVIAGLALGLGLVALLEFRDRSLRTKEDAAAVLNLPVLATVPTIPTRRERRRAALLSSVCWCIAVVLVAVTTVTAWSALQR